MKSVSLGHGKVAFVDDDDFELVNKFAWHFSQGYARRTFMDNKGQTKKILMHNQILGYREGQEVDHINSNGCDNQRGNLRFCSRSQNMANTAIQKKNTSKYKGVTFNKAKGKWMAQIMVNGRNIYLGLFDDAIQAAEAYDLACKDWFGEFAKTNF